MCIRCEIEAKETFDKIQDEINEGTDRDFTYLEMMDVLMVANLNDGKTTVGNLIHED